MVENRIPERGKTAPIWRVLDGIPLLGPFWCHLPSLPGASWIPSGGPWLPPWRQNTAQDASQGKGKDVQESRRLK